MATRFLAPSMGEGIEEMTVVNWLKKEGDAVKEHEVLVELETDKVTTEIPSPTAGTLLKILAQNNEVVKVGATLAWIGQPGEALDKDSAEKVKPVQALQEAAPSVTPQPVSDQPKYTGRVSPLVKKLVEENEVDLDQVHGTGLGGRITKEDVLNFLETSQAKPLEVETPAVQAAAAPVKLPSVQKTAPFEEMVPLSSLKRQIAERMVASQRAAPHVLTVMEADLSKVLAHRAANKAAFAAQGIHLTLTAYFCSATIKGLKAYPDVNSSWTDEGLQRHRVINLGVATSLGEMGLIVPVIKDADLLSLQGLAQKINDLSTRARAKKLLPEEVKDGTFTLTNHGSSGSLFASPIIFQPQAGILGTGVMQKRAVVVTDANGYDAIAIRPMIYLSFVFDHRIMSGESGDRFLQVVKDTLENWV